MPSVEFTPTFIVLLSDIAEIEFQLKLQLFIAAYLTAIWNGLSLHVFTDQHFSSNILSKSLSR